MQTPRRRTLRSRRRQRGAAMLVVMLILLGVTAGATMAVYSAQFESRAAGQFRQAAAAREAALAGLDTVTTTIEQMGGARVLEYQMNRAPLAVGTRLAVEEPGAMPGLRSQRYSSMSMTVGTAALVGQPLASDSLTSSSSSTAAFVVDVNDAYTVAPTFVGNAAGTRVDGNGSIQLRYLVTTVTSRGRVGRAGTISEGASTTGLYTAPEAERAAHLRRDVFETTATARATTISGPYAP